jgi:pimeloyl-ACP methyl ester carboxylesterase
MTERLLETSHGNICLKESSGKDLPVLMIHGNSSCNAVFRNQFESGIGESFRLIAPDLPGHGKSENARDPERSYSMPGYADCMSEVLSLLGVSRAAVFGWSLGGHIGLEMISRYPGLAGLMITGTPPVVAADAWKGFRASPHMNLAGKEHFTEEDIDNYARHTCGEPYDPALRAAVARTDGRARLLMLGIDAGQVSEGRRRQPGRDREGPHTAHCGRQRRGRTLRQCRLSRHNSILESVGGPDNKT